MNKLNLFRKSNILILCILILLLIFFLISFSFVSNHNHKKKFKHIAKFIEPKNIIQQQNLWIPIEINFSKDLNDTDPIVTLCQLKYKEYSNSPHSYPKFKDLIQISNCIDNLVKKEKLSILINDIDENKSKFYTNIDNKIIEPTGFIFHESRVGSTLVSNMLATDPNSLVYSESSPPSNVFSTKCKKCDRNRRIEIFRDIINLMGISSTHNKLIFKFQSILSTHMDIILEAFPNTPWIFIYRNPIQTIMSHMDPKKDSNSPPCYKSKHEPSNDVIQMLDNNNLTINNAPNEAWCAVHLNMLCNNALSNYNRNNNKGLIINYESLPGIITRIVYSFFNIEPSFKILTKSLAESSYYSKGREKDNLFKSDIIDKENRATENIKKYANALLLDSYNKLELLSLNSIKKLSVKDYELINNNNNNKINWSKLAEFETPNYSKDQHSNIEGYEENEYIPWSPFSNTHDSKPFERVNCPMKPEEGYPKAFSMVDITNNWNPDDTNIPPKHYDALCHFDYSNETEYEAALAYRIAERPYVAYNIPEVNTVIKKWSNLEYLQKKLGDRTYKTETSVNNHFMYWSNRGGKKNYIPPTGTAEVTFQDWLNTAVIGQNKSIESAVHQYFRVTALSARDKKTGWLFDELTFFQPKKNLFMVEPSEQRGIHCRFGMKSIIAEAHFDGARNSVMMLGGLRRWILTHPNQCINMHMLPKGDPSGRHSSIDWSKPDIDKFPNFVKIMGNEVILQPGDYLYVPTYWIHYIVSLNVNYQCNTRSGKTRHFDKEIRDCGF